MLKSSIKIMEKTQYKTQHSDIDYIEITNLNETLSNLGYGKIFDGIMVVGGKVIPNYVWNEEGNCFHQTISNVYIPEPLGNITSYLKESLGKCMVCQCSKPHKVNISFSENPDHARYICKICDKSIK